MKLRYYQRESVNAVFDYWSEEAGHPLIDMATGTGKTNSMGTLMGEIVRDYPDMRIMNCTHVVELVEGNFKEFIGLWPFAPAGIFAAALGRRDAHATVLFAQLQTVWNKTRMIGHVDVLVIDEVHLVPSDGNTMYRRMIDDLFAINPDMKIVGYTATPYRLDSGRLDQGDDRLFDKVVYTYDIRSGIDDGYLTPITSKPVGTRLDVTGVGKLGGDYKKGALQAAVDKTHLNRAIIDEVMDVESGRKTALFFCAGIEHATHMRDLVREAGRICEVLSGKTPRGERRAMIEAYKRGEIWGICNDNVMSTGTNVPCIDLIVDCAPTASASRYVQRAGRATRVIYPPGFDAESVDAQTRRDAIASWVKPNARYMNFAGNIEAHGPVDRVVPKEPGKGSGEAPIKLCPIDRPDKHGRLGCEEILHASLRVCWSCGYEFEFEETSKLSARSTNAPILSTSEPQWDNVNKRTFRHHPPKIAGNPPSVKCTLMVGLKAINTWLCPQHMEHPNPRSRQFPKSNADRFWLSHGGAAPAPTSVEEWLERADELRPTEAVNLDWSKGKYPEVKGYRAANDNVPPVSADNDNSPADWGAALDDEIPF